MGCEIPVIPGHHRETVKFIRGIDELGVGFLNLNQLEISETNMEELSRRGYEAESDTSFAVKGSETLAGKLLKYCAENTRLKVHYCTVKLKDNVQLKNRLKRRAKNTSKNYDIVTDEGLLIRGALYHHKTLPSYGYNRKIDGIKPAEKTRILRLLEAARSKLTGKCGVPSDMVEVDRRRLRILTGAWIAEELAKEVSSWGLKAAVVEEYPTWDGLIADLKVL